MKEIRWLIKGIVVCSAFFVFSCKPQKQIVTTAPQEKYNKLTPEKEPTVVNIITTFSTDDLQRRLDSKIPELIYEDSNLEDDNYQIRVNKGGPLKLTVSGGLIKAKMPVKVYAKARLDAGFFKTEQETNFELAPEFIVQVAATENWQFQTKTSANGFEWITRPKIKVGPLEMDIAPFIESMILKQEDKIALEIDKIASNSVDTRSMAEKAWGYIQNPISLGDKYGSWLKITPSEAAFVAPFEVQNQLKSGISIKGMTETFVGEKPESVALPLPNLKTVPYTDNSFNVNLFARISQKNASTIAKENLANQTIGTGEKTIKVDDIEMYGNGDLIVVKALLSGQINGMVYLSGLPVYDSTSREIKVYNLQFDIDTKNKLHATADWLLHGVFLKKLEKSLVFPAGAALDEARNYFQKMITLNKINPYVTLDGTIQRIVPVKLLVVDNYFLIQVNAKGNLNLIVSGF